MTQQCMESATLSDSGLIKVDPSTLVEHESNLRFVPSKWGIPKSSTPSDLPRICIINYHHFNSGFMFALNRGLECDSNFALLFRRHNLNDTIVGSDTFSFTSSSIHQSLYSLHLSILVWAECRRSGADLPWDLWLIYVN